MAENHSWLEDKYRAIFGYTGLICAIAGVTMLCPLTALSAYPEEIDLAISFIFPGLFLAAIGLLLWGKLKDSSAILNIKDGAIVIVLSWVIAIAFGTIPFITTSNLNFTQAVFEYASALSTVGLSVGVTAPDAPIGLLWTEIIAMFLGRLEFLPAIVGLIQIYRDVREFIWNK